MSFYTKVGSFSLPGTTTPITVTGLGFQPKAILFFMSGVLSTVSTNIVSSGMMDSGIGYAVISSGNGLGFIQQYNNTGAGFTNEFTQTTRCCIDDYYLSPANFLSDGFTLVRPGVASGKKTRINYLALGGSDITNTKTGAYTTPTALGEYNISSVGFQPDFLLVINPNGPGGSSAGEQSWGIATSGFQGVLGSKAGIAYARTYSVSGEIVGTPYPTTPTNMNVTNRQTLVTFHPSGFIINNKEGTAGTTNIYLALKGGNYKAGYLNTTTSYDLITVSGLNFSPEAVFFMSHNKPISSPDLCSIEYNTSFGAATSPNQRRVSSAHNLYKGAGNSFVTITEYNNEAYANVYSGGLIALMDYVTPTIYGFKTVMDDTETVSGSFVLYVAFGGITQPSYKSSYTAGSGYMIVPNEDISTSGTWYNEVSGSTLYPSLSDLDDNTYAWYDNAEWGSYFEVGLANPTSTPSGLHALVWRGKRKAGTRQASLKCELKQGSGIIVTDTQTIADNDVHEFTRPLTTSEINSITNYNDLKIRVTILDII